MKTVAVIVAASVSAFTATSTSTGPAGGSTPYEADLFDALQESATQAADPLPRYTLTTRAAPGRLRVNLIRQPAPTNNHLALVTGWRGAIDRDRHVSSATPRFFRAAFPDIALSQVDERLYTEINL